MGLFIAFIMVFSIFGFVINFAIQPSVSTAKYGDFKFRVVNQQYITKINGDEYKFVFFPMDLEYIMLSDEVKQLLAQPVLTVTYDPKSNLSQNLGEAQYYMELQLSDEIMIERALIDNAGTSLPQKSCADATSSQPVIDLRISGVSGIRTEDSCIIVTALDAHDLYQQVERIVYTVLGVMS